MAKPNRSRVIGDPLKKFKRPSSKQQCHPGLRKHLERTMEEDHREGRAFSAAIVVSTKSGLPDQWFFEKARALGYRIDDEQAFWEEQCRLLKTEKPEDINDYVEKRIAEVERTLRRDDEESFEEAVRITAGTIEKWRESIRKQVKAAYEEGRQKAEKMAKNGDMKPL